MRKLYMLFFLVLAYNLNAQTISYPQQVANYNAFYSDNGGNFDNGSDEFGMWANGVDPKQSAAWRTFTDDGTTTGTPTTMAIGNSFTITVSATRAYGQIGIALLASPTVTTGWLERHNNYAVQVNMNGEASGSYMPWEVVSQGLTTDVSAISGSTSYADFKFKFTLLTANTMEVSMNDGTEVFIVTLDKSGITGYCVYLADDWNGSTNANIFWKQTSEYSYTTLGVNDFESILGLNVYPNPVKNTFFVNKNVSELKIYDLTGKLVKEFNGNFNAGKYFDVSNLAKSLYLLKIKDNSGKQQVIKLVKL